MPNNDEKSLLSRRKLLVSMGMAGTAMVAGGLLQSTAFASGNPTISVTNVSELRLLTGLVDGQSIEMLCYSTPGDGGGGRLYADGSDISSADDGGLTFVAADGMRMKRAAEQHITPQMFGVVDGQESGVRLQAYLDALGADDNTYSYDMTCETTSNRLLKITGGTKIKTVQGFLAVTAASDLRDEQNRGFITLSNCGGWYFADGFSINGYTGFTARKRIIDGLVFEGCRQIVIERVEARGGEGFAVTLLNNYNDNMATIKKLVASNFGWKPGMGKLRSYAYIGDNGSAVTSNSYRSFIQIDLTDFYDYQIMNGMLWINNSPQWIMAYDRAQQQATIYPGYTPSYGHGPDPKADVIFGGGLFTLGGDSGECKADALIATNCGIAYADRSLYGAIVSRLTTQACGAAYLSGNATSSVGGFGTVVLQPYFETNSIDLISISASGGGTFIAPIALNASKCFVLNPPGSVNNNFTGSNRFNIFGSLNQTPANGSWYNEQEITERIAGSYALGTVRPFVLDGYAVSRSRTITLKKNVIEEGRGFNSRSMTLFRVPGSFMIVGESGYTINGQASMSWSSAPDGLRVKAILDGTDWKTVVYYPCNTLSGTAAYDPGVLNDGSSTTTVISVIGAALGDIVSVSFNTDLQGVELYAWVNAADSVTVRFKNDTGSAVTLPPGNLLCRIQKS